MSDTALKVENLKAHFPVKSGLFTKEQMVKIVDGVSFGAYPRETFGLVGESGCGKSAIDRAIVKLYEPASRAVYYRGEGVTKTKGSRLVELHRNVQMILQDPYASLNPRMTVGEIIHKPMDIHRIFNTKEERGQRVRKPLDIVGLKLDHIRRYPHEFSGGQHQHIGIARTFALDSQFIARDKPISVLDVFIRAQVINLLEHIQKGMDISYLSIAHDLNMAKYISDRISAMYLGNLVEIEDSDDVYHHPLHLYAQALLSMVSIPDPCVVREKKRIVLEGELPDPLDIPNGRVFRIHCPNTTEHCVREKPGMIDVEKRTVAYFLYEK